MVRYNKLVRDRIPEMIRAQGETPVVRVLDEAEYRRCLEDKLDEEVAEFHASGDIEELADILEVVYALCRAKGHTLEELREVCLAKREKRGGFDGRIFLIEKHG